MSAETTTLLYDGDCGFCSRCVAWGLGNLAAFPNPVAFQSITPDHFGLTSNDVRKAVWLISGEKVLSGARAVAWILQMQTKVTWRLIGGFIDWLPIRPLAALGYRLVAINRHRLPGATTNCKVVKLD